VYAYSAVAVGGPVHLVFAVYCRLQIRFALSKEVSYKGEVVESETSQARDLIARVICLVVELQRAPEPGRELSRIDHAIVYIFLGGRLKSKSKR
jgi:hypothetical protein